MPFRACLPLEPQLLLAMMAGTLNPLVMDMSLCSCGSIPGRRFFVKTRRGSVSSTLSLSHVNAMCQVAFAYRGTNGANECTRTCGSYKIAVLPRRVPKESEVWHSVWRVDLPEGPHRLVVSSSLAGWCSFILNETTRWGSEVRRECSERLRSALCIDFLSLASVSAFSIDCRPARRRVSCGSRVEYPLAWRECVILQFTL